VEGVQMGFKSMGFGSDEKEFLSLEGKKSQIFYVNYFSRLQNTRQAWLGNYLQW
jgi:hypothetical protein